MRLLYRFYPSDNNTAIAGLVLYDELVKHAADADTETYSPSTIRRNAAGDSSFIIIRASFGLLASVILPKSLQKSESL